MEEGKDHAMVHGQWICARCKQGLMTVSWDTGSNIHLVWSEFDRATGWDGKVITLSLTTSGMRLPNTRLCYIWCHSRRVMGPRCEFWRPVWTGLPTPRSK